MSSLLYLESSPRGSESVSSIAAQTYLEALPNSVAVTHLSLFDAELPEFAATMAGAKYKTMFGQTLSEQEQRSWKQVEALVAQFLAADHYLLSVPMWNLGVPYKLKQYIDLITHPGMTFEPAAEGMKGLASGRATIIYSRGGDYSATDSGPDPYDFQSPYLCAWLAMVGIDAIDEVPIQRTMAGPEVLESALAEASTKLTTLAQALQ